MTDRFDYASNLSKIGSYGDWRGAFWPPAASYAIAQLDLAAAAPPLGEDVMGALAVLKSAVEAEWAVAKRGGDYGQRRFADPSAVATAMRRIAQGLPSAADRDALALRANMVMDGYDLATLAELFAVAEDITVVAGHITTWPGKQVAGLPTAFAGARDPARHDIVARAAGETSAVAEYLRDLHADLRLGDVPIFVPANLFFMAGEGNRHPKHIAYFLPEDEGVANSPLKKTYYFANAHRALLDSISAPLAAEYLRIGTEFNPGEARFAMIPAVGVLGHEYGHFVRRPATDFAPLRAQSSWITGVLQETAADVFGVLILTEVWSGRLGLSPEDTIAYYLAECFRYLSRGLGCFPDSDGMFLQLSYLVQLGALTLTGGQEPFLSGDPGTVLAGLRSLARVLADVLLAGDATRALALHDAFGPGRDEPMRDLVTALRRLPFTTVEYLQDHVHPAIESAVVH